MKFREHRGGLKESLETAVEVTDLDQLVAAINNQPGMAVSREDLVITPYSTDSRLEGWENTQIVSIRGYGVAGFLAFRPCP